MAKNRTCVCCFTRYSYCPTCGGADRLKPTWYTNYCSEDCMTLWKTAIEYNMNIISKQEAKTIVESLNLKDTSKYEESVQRTLEKILKEDVVEVPTLSVEEPVVQEEVVVEPTKEFSILVEEEQPVYYKKSKKNKQKSHAVVTEEENE